MKGGAGFMDSVSSVRVHFRQQISICLVTALLCILLAGCDPYAYMNRYPSSNNSTWICENPPCTLEYLIGDDNAFIINNEVIEHNGEMIPIDIWYKPSYYWVLPEGSCASVNIIFKGSWKYSKGDLVLTIEEDNFFDGAYTELRFKKVQ